MKRINNFKVSYKPWHKVSAYMRYEVIGSLELPYQAVPACWAGDLGRLFFPVLESARNLSFNVLAFP